MDTTSHPPTSTGVSIRSLDGLRGVAILLVIFHHCLYFPPQVPLAKELNSLMQSGRLGVGIFFVLSGFLMGLVVFRKDRKFRIGEYAKRRFARIYPPFILSLAFAGIIAIFRGEHLGAVVHSCFLYLATLANWRGVPVPINDVYWSLLIEIHFYIALPLVYQIFRRVLNFPGLWTCILFAIVPVAIRLWIYGTVEAAGKGWNGFGLAFPQRMDAFAFGLCFSLIYLRRRRVVGDASSSSVSRNCWLGAGLIVLAHLLYAATFALPSLVSMERQALFLEAAYLIVQLGVFLLLWMIFDASGTFSKLLSSPALVFLGLVSYEWYLFHYPLEHLCKDLLPSGSPAGYLGKVLIPSVGSLVISALVYYRFSRPLQNLIRGER